MMKNCAVVRNFLDRMIAFSHRNDGRTASISVVALMLTILSTSVWLGFAEPVDGAAGSKGGKKVPHSIQFDGDIQSVPMTADLNPKNPLATVDLDDFVLTFPASTTGTGCDTAPGDPLACDWGDYGLAANNPWTGPLSIRKRKGGANWHIGFNEGTNGTGGQINLVVNGPAAETQSGNTTTLTFTDVTGGVSAISTPDGVNPDSDNRCLRFSVTATKQ